MVLSPNNSVPSFMIPSPFLSYTSKPSFLSTQPVFSANPFASKSKCGLSISFVVFTPFPSRSNIIGELIVLPSSKTSHILSTIKSATLYPIYPATRPHINPPMGPPTIHPMATQ